METQNRKEAGATKRCSVCGIVKPASEFYATKKSADGLLNRCRSCHIAAVCSRQREIPDQINLKNARWKRNNRRKVNAIAKRYREGDGRITRHALERRSDLKRNYGVTPEWYDAKWQEQGEGCGICGSKTSGAKNRRPHVDHNELGARGILCHRCNTALERIENDPEWGRKALAYLAKYARTSRDTAVDSAGSNESRRTESLQQAEFPSDLGRQQNP